VLAASAAAVGCAPVEQDHDHDQDHDLDMTISQAVAVMSPTEGNEARGVVTFTRTEEGIVVVADLVGLEPGKHGFHIHEFGDCSATDGTSAGGHFNPEGTEHAGPHDSSRHVGDLGNVEAGENGTAHHELTDIQIAFTGEHSIIGRGVILHAGEDDLTSQPTGAAGARVACGVVGIARQ
jgi:Cu-Zn family superoxide dismutase